MELKRSGREFYTVSLALTDALDNEVTITAAEASFDGGLTWTAGTEDPTTHRWQWLVAGPDASTDNLDGVTLAGVITAYNITPLVRVNGSPEIVVDDGPVIQLSA